MANPLLTLMIEMDMLLAQMNAFIAARGSEISIWDKGQLIAFKNQIWSKQVEIDNTVNQFLQASHANCMNHTNYINGLIENIDHANEYDAFDRGIEKALSG